MNFLTRNKDIIILFIFYLLSNIFLILNFNGIYWDDYCITNQNKEAVLSIFFMDGNVLKGYFHNFLLSFNDGIFIYRCITFCLYFLTGIFIYKILHQVKFLSKYKFIITLLYLIIPLNSAKIALINVPAIVLLFIFYFAFYLLSCYFSLLKTKIYLRWIILLLFFISFIQNSLLVFYALVLIFLYYQNYGIFIAFHNIKQFLFKYFDFIILPILFWVIKDIYLKPHELYADYNVIHFGIKSFLILIASFYFSFIKPIFLSIIEIFNHYIIFMFFTLISSLFIINKFLTFEMCDINKKQVKILIILGVFIFILAVFPYAVVHKLPSLDNMNSRHQILVPLGFSFLYSAILLFIYIRNKILYKIFLIFSISIFLTKTYGEYLNYQKDWFYQISIMKHLKNNNIIKNNTTFIYKLVGRKNLADKRNLGFYQLNGLSRYVFNDTKRFFVQKKADLLKYKKYKNYEQYNFKEWKYNFPVKILIIIKSMDDKLFYKILYNYYFNKLKFYNEIRRITIIKVV